MKRLRSPGNLLGCSLLMAAVLCGGRVLADEPEPPSKVSVAALSRSLMEVGLTDLDVAIHGGLIRVSANFGPGECTAVGRKAAARVFSETPASSDRVELNDRGGKATGCPLKFNRSELSPDPVAAAATRAPSASGRVRVEQRTSRYMPLFGNVPWRVVKLIEPDAPPPAPPVSVEEVANVAKPLFDELEKQKLHPLGLEMTASSATLHVEPQKFRKPALNAGRAARAMAETLPKGVEKLTVAQSTGGIETSRLTLFRNHLEKARNNSGSPEELWLKGGLESPVSAPWKAPGYYQNPASYPHFSWDILPVVRPHLGDGQDGKYRGEVYATFRGQAEIMRGLSVTADLTQDLFGNLDQVNPRVNTHVPRVRSDIASYTREGRTAITRLSADYLFSPRQSLYVRASAGIFEMMYGGAGGEILYRPYGENWAVGADLNWVRQRDFDQMFRFGAYKTLTGHGSVYYEIPRYNLKARVDAGRYLAGDNGVTFDLSREFDNGIRVGAWATVTDMPRAEFGSGRFDKGIYLSIPFDMFWPAGSRRTLGFNVRNLARDGGQRLDIAPRLYDVLDEGRAAAFARGWSDLLK